jgi:FAD-dependent oxidoreductase domain-containing protein 1
MSHDVVIVGGGAMGSSTAYHLMKADPSLSVAVIERDSSYARASTTLSDGNVRIQFNLEENIRMSQYALEVLRTFDDAMATESFKPDVGARHQGNLFFADETGKAEAMRGIETQRQLGCDVTWMASDEIQRRFPGLRLEGLVGGSFAQVDGSVDPSAVLRGFRSKAKELGANYLDDEVVELLSVDDVMSGVRLRSGRYLMSPVVVNCAGAWSADLVRPLGLELPVIPLMRTVYVVSTTVPTAGMPSLFLPSGVYAIPESDRSWLIAWSLPEDPIGFDFTPASQQRFTDLIWPELHSHLPVFDSLKVETAWAGLYDVNTMDGNAILGEWPRIGGLFLAAGFSGHGFQQSPAVGRYLAELIVGRSPILDLSRLGGQRVLDNEPLHEHAGRLI